MLLVAWASRITNRGNEKIKTMKEEKIIVKETLPDPKVFQSGIIQFDLKKCLKCFTVIEVGGKICSKCGTVVKE